MISGRLVAVKTLRGKMKRDGVQEIKLLTMVPNLSNIVQMLHSIERVDSVHILMELMDQDLSEFNKQKYIEMSLIQ